MGRPKTWVRDGVRVRARVRVRVRVRVRCLYGRTGVALGGRR